MKKGTIPVLVSAHPFGKSFEERQGKCADIFTGSIARMIHLLTGCHVFLQNQNETIDPNYDPINGDGDYKNSVIDVIRKENYTYIHRPAWSCVRNRDLTSTFWGPMVPNNFCGN